MAWAQMEIRSVVISNVGLASRALAGWGVGVDFLVDLGATAMRLLVVAVLFLVLVFIVVVLVSLAVSQKQQVGLMLQNSEKPPNTENNR